MNKRPKSLLIGNAERPAPGDLAVLGAQHAALALVFLVYAVMTAKASGFSPAQQQAVVAATALACGLGALMQARGGRVGSGLLVVPIASPIFMPIAIQAGLAGGPTGIAAVVLMGGLIQLLFSSGVRRVRAFFPPEVCGVVVAMLGVALLPGALRRSLGLPPSGGADPGQSIDPSAAWIAFSTLAAMVVASVWLRGGWRFFAMLIGCAAGLCVAALLGKLEGLTESLAQAPIFAVPHFAFPRELPDPALWTVVLVLAMVSAIDAMGILVGTERLDDAHWIRPNFRQVGGGIRAIGLTNLCSGLLGGVFTGLSGSNLGLAFATGVTARVVGFAVGGLLIVVSFLPQVTELLLALPEAVLGGLLIYASACFLVCGADLALSRMLSQRRMLVIGLSLAGGIAVQTAPELTAQVPGVLGTVLRSPLAFTALLAVVLNAVLRIGIASQARLSLPPGTADRTEMLESLEALGEQWGLHRTTVAQCAHAILEAMELIAVRSSGPTQLEIRSNEVHVDLALTYEGAPIDFPSEAPAPETLLEDPDAGQRMAAWMLSRYAQAIRCESTGSQTTLHLRIES
jgi:xanthine permease XanP